MPMTLLIKFKLSQARYSHYLHAQNANKSYYPNKPTNQLKIISAD